MDYFLYLSGWNTGWFSTSGSLTVAAIILSTATFFYISESDYLLRSLPVTWSWSSKAQSPSLYERLSIAASSTSKAHPHISKTGGLGKRKSRNPPIYLIIRCFFHYLHLHIKTDTQSGLMILVAIFSIHIFPRGNFRLRTYILKGANFKRS